MGAQCGWEQHRVDFYKVGNWGGGGGGGVYPHLISCGGFSFPFLSHKTNARRGGCCLLFLFFFPFWIIPCSRYSSPTIGF